MDVRKRILTEATNLFFQYGIRNITMDDIAEKLGISKRTIYETFKDKNELLINCFEEYSKERYKVNEEIIKNSQNVLAAICSFIQSGAVAINLLNPAFFSDLKKYHNEIWVMASKQQNEKNYNLAYRLLRKGINEGIFRKDINLDIVVKIILEQMKLLVDNEVFSTDKYSRSEVFKNMVINFIRGIATNKGIELIDSFES
ncbi:MAG: TetR/AcrR family transcriptional regulator [Bacteroidales bacterium]|nr:TetR/AcrR family transcriptional regulator [Bacteroidales bacterium]